MAPKNPEKLRQPSKEEQEKEESSYEDVSSDSESGETEEEDGSSEEEEEIQVTTKPNKPQSQTLVSKSEAKSTNSNSDSSETETEEEEESSDEEKENQVTTKAVKPQPQTLVSKSEQKSKSPAKTLTSKSESKLKPTLRVHASDSSQTLAPKIESKAKLSSDSEAESGGSPSGYKVRGIRKPSAKREREGSQELSKGKKSKTEEKKPPSVALKLWSDEDEVAVLNGVIDFRKMKGGNDNNSEEIYNFIKGKLQGGFNKDQLKSKITRLKKRFLNAVKKSGDGSDPVFSKPHEDLLFELSKKIWGDAVNSSVVKSAKKDVGKNGNVKKEIAKAEVGEKDDDEGDFWVKYPHLSSSIVNMRGPISEASVSLLKQNVRSIGDSKAKELNEKWRQLFVEENELNCKMLTLMAEQTKLCLNRMKDS